MRYAMVAATLLLLASCGGERVQNAPAEGDVLHLPAMEWRVVDRQTLDAVYVNSGMTVNVVTHGRMKRRDNLTGFVGRRGEQWVVYTLQPQYVDDAATCALGHEVLHTVLGDYHD